LALLTTEVLKMKKRLSLALALLLAQSSTLAQVATQQTTQTPAQSTPTPRDDSEDSDVVRITTNLVQFDAVVTDKKGQQVTDLQPEDFEVTVNGRRQSITNFSYVVAQPGAVSGPTQPAPPSRDRAAPYVPPARMKPGDVRRTVALVVDDLGVSFESMAYVRKALKKFVDEQMQPGDLVAIMRTSAGMGALQQFTSDKTILNRAIERVRWYPRGRVGVNAFEPIGGGLPSLDSMKQDGPSGGGGQKKDNASGDHDSAQELEDFRTQTFSVGTLGALSFIVRGMDSLPGRKSVVLFSEGFKIVDRKIADPRSSSDASRVLAALRRLVDLANRAAVVFYAVDARGLPYLGLNAADSSAGMSSRNITDQLNSRSSEYFDTQTGLSYLAAETGGLFMHDSNDLGGAAQRALDDQKGYYLIGFRPDDSVFDTTRGRRRFNDLGVKVKRSGLRVRSRSGFIGVPDSEAKPPRTTRVQQLVGALASPFASGDVPLRLTSLVGGDRAGGAVVSSLMHIDMNGVKFTEEPDGWRKAVIDVVALTFGEEGNVIDEVNRTETVRVRGEAYDLVRREGLVYQMQVPVKKPGAYQLRVAVRDASTEKLGSASQFIEVPDLNKNRLALSGIVLQSSAMTAASSATDAGVERKEPDTRGSAAVRRFRRGEQLDYFYNIYNAELDKASGRPRLQTQMRLYRDREKVYEGPLTDFDAASQTDFKNLHAATRIRLDALAAGEYVLQVVVTDALAPEKRRAVTQWIDFEVIK
jgi:VWFA-related protein